MRYAGLIVKQQQFMVMYYNENEAREQVIKACSRLVERKLIARTWGNISARISADEFIITPSGMAYESLVPESLVRVRISDLSHEGDIKPSSEKGVHAAAYSLRADVKFIVHTHQHYATAVSVEGKDTDFAVCIGYALSGTKTLCRNAAQELNSHPDAKAFLMARHGALLLGESCEEAFMLAEQLENESRRLFEEKRHDVTEGKAAKPWLDDYAQMFGFGSPADTEDPEAVKLVRLKNAAAAGYARSAKPLCVPDVLLQHAVYKLKYSRLIAKKV